MIVDGKNSASIALLILLGSAQAGADDLKAPGTNMLQSVGSQKICSYIIRSANVAGWDYVAFSVPAPSSWNWETCKNHALAHFPNAYNYQLSCLFDTPVSWVSSSFGAWVDFYTAAPVPSPNCGW
ncbi:hypothetical protein [Myxococcus hansupus]|uniref:hypothetical protein n=1 Tax=Pseudomyxococcus hansupus TaxID=1297742 RepID=UPI00118769BF|nr:hypothetical protein [Myxococcus hansupus]